MRAVQIHRHGGPEVLALTDLPLPTPANDLVLVRVKAAALNHLDIWVRAGFPGIPLPIIPGSDGAGEVVAIGSDVRSFREGDHVLLQPVVYCGTCPACHRGRENFCREFGIFGETLDGTNCEYMLVPAKNLRPIPPGLNFTDAAAFPLVAMTAYTMLIRRANLQKGETVLVWGAGSGIGSMAIQIARWKNARVIATAGNDVKLELAARLGADEVLNHYEQNVFDTVRQLVGRTGVDVIFEHVGQATWDTSLKLLARGGRIVTCGATTGAQVKLDLRHLFYKQQSLLGSTMGDVAGFDEILELVTRGIIQPVIDRTFPLAEIRAAHEYLAGGRQFGKVVLTI